MNPETNKTISGAKAQGAMVKRKQTASLRSWMGRMRRSRSNNGPGRGAVGAQHGGRSSRAWEPVAGVAEAVGVGGGAGGREQHGTRGCHGDPNRGLCLPTPAYS